MRGIRKNHAEHRFSEGGILLAMPSDSNPIEALRHQFELEDSSQSTLPKIVLKIASNLPPQLHLGWPFDNIVKLLKKHIDSDSGDRIKIMLETCANEILKLDNKVNKLKDALSPQDSQQREEVAIDLVVDAARKASNTRGVDRVKRIGLILANGLTEQRLADEDEIEELMRVAVDVSDKEVQSLRELVRIEGDELRNRGRIERYNAHPKWERGSWGGRVDGELDSVFSKLESYGLVAHIPPPNNLNIMADFQNRYVLLHKGLRFVDLILQRATTSI
jgi:hypothetical protein